MARVKIQYRLVSKENYEKFCLEYPHINLSFDKWKEVHYEFMREYVDNILETGDKSKLLHGFGYFSVNKKKSKKFVEHNGKQYINLPIDWKKTRQMGKKVYNMNNHTDGYRFKWMWFKRTCYFYHSDLYNFKPSRELSRKLARYLTKPNSHYKDIYREWTLK